MTAPAPRRRAALPWLVLLALAVTAPACTTKVGAGRAATTSTAAPSADTGTSARSTTTTGAGAPTLDWTSCGDDECATLQVPVDYTKPTGATLSIALERLPATDPSKRIGSLLVNPGGPGGSGIELATGNLWPDRVRQRFDIVGFDPRGVGKSTPIECHRTLAAMYHADPSPRTAAQTTDLLTRSRTFVDECAARYRSLLPHLGTRDVARDMDRIRQALGEQKISYLGYSYGTSIGQVYADLFPTRVRAMVLDGVVKLGQPGIEAAQSQGRSFERNLTAFEADCSSKPSCSIGPDPGAVLAAVEARVERAPIPAPGADRPLGPGEFQLGVGQALYATFLWPQLDKALHDAAAGDGSGLVDLADEYLQRQGDGSYPNVSEVYFAVSCLDWSWPRSPQAYLTAGRAVAAQAPVLGEGIVTDYVRCAYWPTPPQPLTPPRAVGSPPILVVSTTNDPATPYQDGVDLAKLLPKGVLLTHKGDGHTIYAQGDPCVDGIVNRYLVDLQPPADGMTCT